MKEKLQEYGIKITNEELLNTALTHTSYSNEHKVDNYERLEFLGDAVLELVTSEYFFLNTKYSEGDMSKIRASYVCEEALFHYAKDISLERFIRVGHGQEKNINATIIADVLESVIAVIYLENGLDKAKKFILDLILPYVKDNVLFIHDYKSTLQEMVQTDKKSLEYIVVSETGPAHDKNFTVEVRIDGMLFGTGFGKSKKEAEQNAAKDAYRKSCK
jgi:ribonuclease-3